MSIDAHFLEFLETANPISVPYWPEPIQPPAGGYPPVVVPSDIACTHEQAQWTPDHHAPQFLLTCLACGVVFSRCIGVEGDDFSTPQKVLHRPRLWFEEHPPPHGEYTPSQEDYANAWDDVDLEMPQSPMITDAPGYGGGSDMMTMRQLDQQIELDALLPSDSQMCAWCAQSMPRQDEIIICSRACAQASIEFWSARMDVQYTISFT